MSISVPKKKKMAKKPSKVVPQLPIQSDQFDLFRNFIADDKNSVSNTVETWESIPKYFFTAKQIEKIRTKDGLAKPYRWKYLYKGEECEIKIQPALIEIEEGVYKAYFPGVSEEMIEEALKKILSEQNLGVHDPKNLETWVKFSLKMIQRELKSRNKTRSLTEIKHSIEVMSSCILTFYTKGKETWKGSILQDLVTVGRKEYLANTEALHVARLPLFISHGINSLGYRQFNYERLMQCNEQLTRWIYKRMINRFTQANMTNDYHFMYSDLKNSGLLQQAREIDNRKKAIRSLNELKEKKIIRSFTTDDRKEGRTIVDVKYVVVPTNEFVSEQIAANKRNALKKDKNKALKIQ